MNSNQNYSESQSTMPLESNKNNSTIASVALMLGTSQDAVHSWINSTEFEHIQNLEKEKTNLKNTVNRIMSDRMRIKEEIDNLFKNVKA